MPSNEFGFLFPQHIELMLGSGIAPEVARARGYVSVDTKAELGRKGFSPAQQRVPGLLLPVWRVTGERAFYQYRPDEPRINSAGRVVKYEMPTKVRMALDVHPAARGWIADPSRPLFVTEGIRKADAAVTRGLCCIALLGVWNWRGRNEKGGLTVLADWEAVALKGRQVYVVFDSDVMLKASVHEALVRLRAFLEVRGAPVALTYLPSGEGGMKVGLDDFLLGHTVDDLLSLGVTELRRPQPNTTGRVAAPRWDLEDLRRRAAPVLEAHDPLVLVEGALRSGGYGGDLRPAMITYLASTTRVLAGRSGTMPAHLLLVGPPGAGKNYTINAILRLLPPEAYHVIDAGSPRSLIYDAADLQQRVLVFSEADSLPSGEENPAASAVRNLLQDGVLRYQVTVRDPETRRFTVQTVTKPGPTVMITTAVRRLGLQLDTRLFTVPMADDQGQVRAALRMQSDLELASAPAPPAALVALQAYLQATVPWEAVVPFVRALAKAVAQSPIGPRVLRDLSRLLALIKAVAVLRHRWRRRDDARRVIAEIEDYAAVFDLVRDIYTATVTGAGRGVREAVEAVGALREKGEKPITITSVGRHMSVSRPTAQNRVHQALAGGWLANLDHRRRVYDLDLGEPLPPEAGLPRPEDLQLQVQAADDVTAVLGDVEVIAQVPDEDAPAAVRQAEGG
ncbi:MAG: DUF3854 domain-containing protein [bacterium]